MAGVSPVSFTGLNSAGLVPLFQGFFGSQAVIQNLAEFVPAQITALRPENNSVLKQAIRALRSQETFFGSSARSIAEGQSRFSELVNGFTAISSSLASIQDLINDTIATPGNAAQNQAAIETLNRQIDRQIRLLRILSPDASFDVTGADPQLGDFRVTRVSDALALRGSDIDIDINLTVAAQRAVRTDFVDGLLNANGPVRFRISGPLGYSPIIDISPGQARLTDAIRNISTAHANDTTFRITGNSGSADITILGGGPAQLANYISGLGLTNADDVTFNITGALGTTAITVNGGQRATLSDYVTGLNAANTTGGSFDLTGPGGTANITVAPATAAEYENFLTGVATTSVGGVTFDVTGAVGTRTITINGGTQATVGNFVTNLSTANTGESEFSVVATGGTATLVHIEGGTNALYEDFISGAQSAGAGAQFRVTSATGTAVIGVTAGVARAQAVTDINTALSAAGITDVVAQAGTGGAGVGKISLVASVADAAFFAEGVTAAGGVSFSAAAYVANNSQAGVIAAVNLGSATSKVEAIAGGAGSVTVRSTQGGAATSITATRLFDPAGDAIISASATVSGTNGDDQAAAIITINNQTAFTGIQAVGGTTGTSITLRSVAVGAAAILQTSNITDPAGGVTTAGAISITGADADTQATLIVKINAQTATTGVRAIGGGTGDAVTLESVAAGSATTISTANIVDGAGGPAIGAADSDTGTDSQDSASVIAEIMATAGATGVTAVAGSTADAVTLETTASGSGAFITVASVANPAGEVALLANQTVSGSNADDRTAIINKINAQTGVTGVTASNGTIASRITLTSVGYGTDQFVTTTNIGGDPAGEIAITYSTIFGTDFSQADAIAAINAHTAVTGVEAFAGTDADDVSIRTSDGVLGIGAYGTQAHFATIIVNNDNNVFGANSYTYGIDAQAEVSINGGPVSTITASTNEFNASVGGVDFSFSIPVNTVFDPAAVTLKPNISDLTNLYGFTDTLGSRENFLSLSHGNVLGKDSAFGGLFEIDVTTDTATALNIVNDAIGQVDAELLLATSLKTAVIDIQAGRAARGAATTSSLIDEYETLDSALNNARLTRAEIKVENTSAVLAQYSQLFPSLARLFGVS